MKILTFVFSFLFLLPLGGVSGEKKPLALAFDASIEARIQALQLKNLAPIVKMLSSYKNRYSRSETPNVHVMDFMGLVKEMLEASKNDIQLELYDHKKTKQKTLVARVLGRSRPEEIVILGAHLDSRAIYPDRWDAPGADDNASGCANILEVLRVLSLGSPLERTVEFHWYASEENFRIGSKEIAKSYKEEQKNVVGMLNLDMTAYPSEGVGSYGLATNFTDPWLRHWIQEVNRLYVHRKVREGRCEGPCSDHASWHGEGFSSAFLLESRPVNRSKKAHMQTDTMEVLDFEHSHGISQLALGFVLTLGESDLTKGSVD